MAKPSAPQTDWRQFLRIPAARRRGFLLSALLCAALLLAAGPAVGQDASPVDPDAAATYRAVLDRYCVTCHNGRLRTAGLELDAADLTNVSGRPGLWEKVVRKLRGRDMPPPPRRRPAEAVYDGFAGWLETTLDAAAAADPRPGRPALHRLNRTEYANAVRDLLALEVDVTTLLPPDDSTHGFDNIADALGVSPLLLESYVTAARKISRLAVADPAIPPSAESYVGAHDETQDTHREGMPFGTRGGLRVTHHFPVDGEYEIRIRLERSQRDDVRGLHEPHELELAVDGGRVRLFALDGGPHMYRQVVYDGETPALTADDHLVLRAPLTAGPHVVTATFPVKSFGVSESLSRPLLRSYPTPNSVAGLPAVSRILITGPLAAAGHGDTPTRRRIFTCRPDAAQAEAAEAETAEPAGAAEAVGAAGAAGTAEAACAERILAGLARRAYRGLGADADVRELVGFHEAGRAAGGFEAGIETALWRLLASPKFLFRFEFDPPDAAPGDAYPLGDLELASRLSFFLWSSIPDEPLLAAAERGELRRPGGLERQVRRMLADPRAAALVDNFAGQWLYLRNLQHIVPEPRRFRNFDNNLRRAFRRETELLFASIVAEDRSVLELLDADYTFVNERLARHYGIPGVRGSHFRRVAVTDEHRRGLLGHGSILTVTSYANRTSPVLRGKWVLENLLGAPPPPPPADVPDLPEEDGSGPGLTMRERLAAHRANPVCASCHATMDPIGFGLENFDAVGAWRQSEHGAPIDASGTLPNGAAFEGPAELRAALLARPETFVRALTAKLATYALGRGVEPFDAPAIRAILAEAADSGYTFSSLVLGIARSVPFRMREAAAEIE
ncbi:MAG: DUF1592 domain-containing protein [Acidobacteria bacterium]|nr:DUF1592 domain-containing protein [Acidobacteriota bacterium]